MAGRSCDMVVVKIDRAEDYDSGVTTATVLLNEPSIKEEVERSDTESAEQFSDPSLMNLNCNAKKKQSVVYTSENTGKMQRNRVEIFQDIKIESTDDHGTELHDELNIKAEVFSWESGKISDETPTKSLSDCSSVGHSNRSFKVKHGDLTGHPLETTCTVQATGAWDDAPELCIPTDTHSPDMPSKHDTCHQKPRRKEKMCENRGSLVSSENQQTGSDPLSSHLTGVSMVYQHTTKVEPKTPMSTGTEEMDPASIDESENPICNEILDEYSEGEYDVDKPILRPVYADPDPDSEDENLPSVFHARSLSVIPAWSTKPYTPTIHKFDDSNSGIKIPDLTHNSQQGEVFEKFRSPDLVQKICASTNRYANKIITLRQQSLRISNVGEKKSKQKSWVEVTLGEMYIFIAITMLMVRKKALEVHEYWSTDPLLHQPIFSQLMSRDRYRSILSALHFDEESEGEGRLKKLKILMDHTKNTFRNYFVPYQNLCIEESLVKFNGRLGFRQYIPSKRSQCGIQVLVLCDTKTDYILAYIIHDIEDKHNLGISVAVVTTMLRKYMNKGHSLYTGDWCSSILLFVTLLKNNTNVCGTVRRNRVGLPKFGKVNKGELEAKYTDQMMACKWVDRHEVYFLTTMHHNNMLDTGKIDAKTQAPIVKPEMILDYGNNMESEDMTDLLLSSVGCLQKTKRWYRKIGFHIIDLIFLNSFSVYKQLTASYDYPLGDFHLSTVRQILQKYHAATLPNLPTASTIDSPLRLTGKHKMSPIQSSSSHERAFRRCHVCSHTALRQKRKKVTKVMCITCDKPLCMYPCFDSYHNDETY